MSNDIRQWILQQLNENNNMEIDLLIQSFMKEVEGLKTRGLIRSDKVFVSYGWFGDKETFYSLTDKGRNEMNKKSNPTIDEDRNKLKRKSKTKHID